MQFLDDIPGGRLAIAAVAMTMAAAVWLYQSEFSGSFDARQFQDTKDVDAVVVSVVSEQDWYRILCRVTNHGTRTAEHVVLTARIRDRSGEILALNPLVSISNLPPQASQITSISLPRRVSTAHYTAEVDTTLVAWAR